MRQGLVSLILAAIVLAACSTPAGPVVVEVTATPTRPPPTETPAGEITPAVRAALEALAASLGIDADQITVVSVEAVDWPDGCLGVHRIGVMCTMGIVPGYRIVLAANGQTFEYHTNADGSALTPAGDLPVEPPAELVEAARQALAEALGVALDAITVANVSAVEWPDACLGLARPGTACAEVITPGYLIELAAGGQTYEYHTNQDGSVLRPGSLVLTWERMGGIAGFCDSVAIFRSGEVEGQDCKVERALAGRLTAQERAQLEAWLAEYGSVVVDNSVTPVPADFMLLKLTLYGTGSAQPGEAEQQALAAWAQSVYTRLAQ
jgi:hypothetical protein